ncbi:MAG: 50S ribosomal protein L22 [Kiritimatiellia bacterium]|jgi:large subunit ribosomal protein L22
MRIESVAKYVRLAPSKARPFARRLKGVPLEDALSLTRFSTLKAASAIGKVLRTAVADVTNNHKRSAEDFRVVEVIVEQGPYMKRFWSRARGMVRPVRRRTSHIHVILDDNVRAKK